MESTQKTAADRLSKSNRFQAFPPCQKIWKRTKKCSNSNPCSARPNGPLGTRIRAVDWCWECCDICWRTMRVWVYMRWENFVSIRTVFSRPDGAFILFCFILLSSLLLSSSTRRRYYPQRSCGQDVVTGVVPSPPP